MADKPYTYAEAGVSIAAGNAFVEAIKPRVKRTARAGADAELGGFGAFFDLKAAGYKDPLLVAANDGVGTKLKLAIESGRHEQIGVDLVAMCANDIIVQGAEPLFFLDYFATSALNPAIAAEVVDGIIQGCIAAGCALVGGETAEMPGIYSTGDYDLAGFAVGAVERGHQLTGDRVAPGDIILGLASSGFHSNGYSLIRKILLDKQVYLNSPATFDPTKLFIDVVLEPTRIYVKSVLPEVRSNRIKALAHITGGGLVENVPRVLPHRTHARISADSGFLERLGELYHSAGARIDVSAWELPRQFEWIQELGSITPEEMVRTFNCGIGMVAVVARPDVTDVVASLQSSGETVHVIGTIEDGPLGCTVGGEKGAWGAERDWQISHHV